MDIGQKIEVTYNPGAENMHVYSELLRKMLRDQVHWAYHRDYARKLTHENGRESLALAVEATRLADPTAYAFAATV